MALCVHLELRRTMSLTSKRAITQCKIPIVVVESHQHVLEHIHHVLRRKKVLTEPLGMLHFDAHSDLACPMDIPARLCFQPRVALDKDGHNLYEMLDLSTTGIAEWILPLVLAANLCDIDWIRPPSIFEQFPPGEHTFHVGVWIPQEAAMFESVETFHDLPDSARVRVDYASPYYRCDAGGDSYVATEDLIMRQAVNLRVFSPEAFYIPRAPTAWILDICLDYFCTSNPFVSDLMALSEDFTKALDEVFCLSTLRTSPESARSLQTALAELLARHQEGSSTWSRSLAYVETCRFFTSATKARTALAALESALAAYRGNMSKLVSTAVEAIPYWTMPHRWDLPSDQEIQVTIDDMAARIRQQGSLPLFISVARSAADGFTPLAIVEKLQHQVLKAVHSLCNCACSRTCFGPGEATECCLEIAYDYGQWEGSVLNL